jgi:hypothetical protein
METRPVKSNEPENVLTCPSCGAPRLAHAWDCAKCGAVFDLQPDQTESTEATESDRETGPARPAPPRRPRTSSARRPGAARPKIPTGATPPALTALRDWVDGNRTAAVIISFVVYVLSIWIFGAMVIGGTDSPGAVKTAYRELTGRPVPKGFGPTFAAHFVSRRLVVFDRPDQVFLVLYRDRDGASDGDLRRFAEGVLEVFEVPFDQIRVETASTRDGPIEVPVLRLWGEGGPHLYLIPTPIADGDRAVEAVLGEPKAVLEVVEDMVRYR